MQGEDEHIDDRNSHTKALRGGTALVSVALIALGALVTGCGGNSPSGGVASLGSHTSSSHSSTSSAGASEGHQASPGSQAVAYAACMHQHGIPDFPEPQVSEHGNSVSVKMAVPASIGHNPKFNPAQQACRKLLPGGGPGSQTVLSPAQQAQYLKAAACIRSHGVPNFPDPTFSGGGVHIDQKGLDMSSPTLKAAVRACESLIPGGAGGNGSTHSGSAREAAP